MNWPAGSAPSHMKSCAGSAPASQGCTNRIDTGAPLADPVENDPAGCSKSPRFSPAQPAGKAAGELKPQACPQGYVEDFDEPRTMLASFFSILLKHHSN